MHVLSGHRCQIPHDPPALATIRPLGTYVAARVASLVAHSASRAGRPLDAPGGSSAR